MMESIEMALGAERTSDLRTFVIIREADLDRGSGRSIGIQEPRNFLDFIGGALVALFRRLIEKHDFHSSTPLCPLPVDRKRSRPLYAARGSNPLIALLRVSGSPAHRAPRRLSVAIEMDSHRSNRLRRRHRRRDWKSRRAPRPAPCGRG